MSLSREERRAAFERLAGPSGGFVMVAMDQRESLRTMFAEAGGGSVPDGTLIDFKAAVTEVLSPHASAILLDDLYGAAAMRAVMPPCGLIVAADLLTQSPGEPVADTALIPDFDAVRARQAGAVALKFLLLFRPDDDPDARAELVRRFHALAHAAEMPAILEGVVRPPRTGPEGWNRDDAILQAARELGAMQPDLYKAEVPLHGRGDLRTIERRCREISDALPCPWVVLSSGVASDDFPGAVAAACRGGASGFLAGRGIWMDLVGDGDARTRLREVAVPRLDRLRAVVEASAVPWWERVE